MHEAGAPQVVKGGLLTVTSLFMCVAYEFPASIQCHGHVRDYKQTLPVWLHFFMLNTLTLTA
jgi:hypothetical protein